MPIETYCRRHSITPFLGVPAVGANMEVIWTYTIQAAKDCHVRQIHASDSEDRDITANVKTYKIRFDADPSLDTRYLLKFGSLYLQYKYTDEVRDGLGDIRMWIIHAEHEQARFDP